MKNILLISGLALLTAACGDAPQPTMSKQVQDKLLNQITVEGVRYHAVVLADDALEGREAGTRGYNAAADYVALQYKNYRLKSFNDDGSYFQPINFLTSSLDVATAQVSFAIGDEIFDLKLREDFVMGAGFGNSVEAISANVIFVGYGITSPGNDFDDYADIDVKDKIVVMLSGAPAHFSTDERAYFSRSKAQTAVANGAIGVIGVRTLTDQKRRDFKFYLPGLGSSSMRWLDQESQPYDAYSQLQVSATLSQQGAEKLFTNSPISLEDILARAEEGKSQSFDMGIIASLGRQSNHEVITSSNVVGYIEGSDPVLKDEYVVYGAHLDHIGIRPGKNGDDIHNGLYDNATGIATILEIAKAISNMEVKPKRSIIFISYTAEEKGLRGSSYFVNNPPVAVNQLVANVNIDMPILTFPVNDITPIGAEHSTLLAAAERAAETLNIGLKPDPLPEEVRFVRSDQFSFIKAGIPAIYYKAGDGSADPHIDGPEMVQNFLKNHYHQASDDLSLPFDKVGVENYAKGALLIGVNIANENERPQWLEGDFFGEQFGQK
jgi:Zn-dependent M28 family amino/carboxypeptidase